MVKKKQMLYLQTTEVPASKTAGEITDLLVRTGAREISMQYDDKNKLTGLRFVLIVQNMPVQFALPVRTDPVFKYLNGQRSSSYARQQMAVRDREQAERVAWRQLLRWIQAQFAMIETGMVERHEVFLPYLLRPGTTQTLFEYFSGDGMKLLAAGAGK